MATQFIASPTMLEGPSVAPAVLFVNIGWSERYDGGEAIVGNHEWLAENATNNGELYAFAPDGDDQCNSGIGRGRIDAERLDVVFVAKPPRQKGHRIVGVYFDVRWREVEGAWINGRTGDAVLLPVGKRPRVRWPGRMGMRRWAYRAGASGTEHQHLYAAYQKLLQRLGRRTGDSTWDLTKPEEQSTDDDLVEHHVETEGDPSEEVRPLVAQDIPEARFARAHFAATDAKSAGLSGFRPGMHLREALTNLIRHPDLESVRITAFRGNRGFFELVGLAERVRAEALRDVRVMFAAPHGATLDLAKWLEQIDSAGCLQAREFPTDEEPREMHVKLCLLVYRGGRRVVVTGSANATTAAFCSNEELSVAFSPGRELSERDPFAWFDRRWDRTPRLRAIHFLDERIEVHRRALFPFQLEAQGALSRGLEPLLAEQAVEGGHGGGLLVMPTGAGKTLTAMRWLFTHPLARDLEGQRHRVLWLSHRRELLQHALDAAKHELLFTAGSQKPEVVAYGIDDGGVPPWAPWDRGDLVFASSQRVHEALRRFRRSRKRKLKPFERLGEMNRQK